ncbi:MAG: biotin transporter BioY [Chlamydiales bacterium]|nr:biotin transporter BioY [Chlamydiales bacterium]
MEFLAIKQKKEVFFQLVKHPLLQIFYGSCLIGICAQISIPLYFTPVPFTGQTCGVILVATLLGRSKGALAALLYLMEGAAGVPVFAGGRAGIQIFFGTTGGYLLAYPVQAYLIGWVVQRYQSGFVRVTGVSLICLMQLAVGSLWLAGFVGLSSALAMGFYPFISVELAKVFLIIGLKKGE